MKTLAIGAGAVLAFAAQPSLAAECATVTFSPGTVTLPDYDPIAGGAVQSSFTATINRVKPATRSVRLIFNDSSYATPVKFHSTLKGGGPLYEILDSGGINVAFAKGVSVKTTTNPQIAIPEGPSGDSVQAPYLVNVPANSDGRDLNNGLYGTSLSYSVACYDGASSYNGSDSAVTGPALSLTIPNLVSLTTASPQTLDFENFTTLTQQLNVGLKSTGPINIDLRTENGRKMVRTGSTTPAPPNSYIPYAIKLNGRNVSSDPYILNNAPRAGVAGSQWPLQLSLPSQPSGKVAGNYSDTITLTLTPGT
jgi:spore coat protein U-like protein